VSNNDSLNLICLDLWDRGNSHATWGCLNSLTWAGKLPCLGEKTHSLTSLEVQARRERPLQYKLRRAEAEYSMLLSEEALLSWAQAYEHGLLTSSSALESH